MVTGFLDVTIIVLLFLFKHDVSENGLCLCLQVKAQLSRFLSEDENRIQSPKCCVSSKKQVDG
jgi:hypothetical protein